jgi:hypothetical protein
MRCGLFDKTSGNLEEFPAATGDLRYVTAMGFLHPLIPDVTLSRKAGIVHGNARWDADITSIMSAPRSLPAASVDNS